MKRVDRANYVKDGRYAYEDSPQYVVHLRELRMGTELRIIRPIGFGATISAPHMVSGSNLARVCCVLGPDLSPHVCPSTSSQNTDLSCDIFPACSVPLLFTVPPTL
jgi:hypothetical protein